MDNKVIKIHINDKEVSLKKLIEDFHNIHKIVTDNCKYCKEKGITKDNEKLELIKKITKKYFKEG